MMREEKMNMKDIAKVAKAMNQYNISAEDMKVLVDEFNGNIDAMIKMLAVVNKTIKNF